MTVARRGAGRAGRCAAACIAACAAFGAVRAAPEQDTASRVPQGYVLNCMGCHGPAGAGVPGRIPPLRDSLGYFMRMPEGRAFAVRVPGASNSALSDADLARVLNWMLLRYNRDLLPRDFRPYSADEVARLRRPALMDVAKRRAWLIDALRARGSGNVPPAY
nr:cytochrome c [Burkholderia stabilis]